MKINKWSKGNERAREIDREREKIRAWLVGLSVIILVYNVITVCVEFSGCLCCNSRILRR